MLNLHKRDLILRELYKYKFDGRYYSISWIADQIGISIGREEAFQIGRTLETDGVIQGVGSHDGYAGKISVAGVDYVETNSFSAPNHSILTNTYPQVSNVSAEFLDTIKGLGLPSAANYTFNFTTNVFYTLGDLKVKIESTINSENGIDQDKKDEIVRLLNEVYELVSAKKSYREKGIELLGKVANMHSVYELVTQLVGR